MKSKVFVLIFSLGALITACEMAGQMKEQLSFLMETRKQFGGNWSGYYSPGGCYSIEITNSPRINNNPDSLDYYATIIGRAITGDFGSNYTCMNLQIVNEKKVAIVTKSSSTNHSYDLQLIKRFRERSIEDYMVIKKAIYAMNHAEEGQIEEATKWYGRVEEHQESPFVKLALASIEEARNNQAEAYQIVEQISQSLNDDQLSFYIGGFFIRNDQPEKALKYFHLSTQLNPENPDHWLNLGELYWIDDQSDSSIYFINNAVEADSTFLKAYYRRAQLNFKLGKKGKACDDINYILQVDPGASLPDSIKIICNQNNI